MEALEAILTRRSIRKYTDEPVTPEEEEVILRAAMCAPNTINNRAWAFVVVRDKGKLSDLSRALAPNAPCLKDAAMAVVVCGDMLLTGRGIEDYWQQDCSAATMNLLLAAHAIGLGAVWLGCYPNGLKTAAVAKLLNMPRHILPMGVIAVGHPAESKPDLSAQRYEEHKIHHERWNGSEE